MNFRPLITFLFAGTFVLTFQAQTKKPQGDFIEDSLKIAQPKLVRPQFKFDNRVTFYEGQSLFITGYDAGVLLKDKLRIALGFSRLNEDLNAFKETIDSVDVGRRIEITYGSINIEFNYLNTRFFTLGMPLELAGGYNLLRFKEIQSEKIYKTEKGILLISHFGLSGTFKPIRWFGLKGILGYRKMLFNQIPEFDFNGIFTSIGFNVDFAEIIRDLRMYRLMKRHQRGNNISNAVDIITD
jgi:hypothetical protein